MCIFLCRNYINVYRENIRAAILEGDKLIASAQGYSSTIQSALSPTLTYSVSQDTFLHTMNQNVVTLENERKTSQKRLNSILLVMTLMFGGLSVGLTIVLRDHKKRHGQQVPDSDVWMTMVILDMSSRLGEIITDIIYTIVLQPFNYFKTEALD